MTPTGESNTTVSLTDRSLKDEVLKLWTHRIILLSIAISFFVLSVVYVLMTPAEYQSVSEVVPPSFDKIKSLNFLKNRFDGFGSATEKDLERLSAALKSDSVFVYMARKFNLEKHYGLSDISESAARMKALRAKYDGKISVKVTGLSTVQITVYDEVPETAAAIARAFVTYASDFTENIAARQKGIAEVEKTITQLQKQYQTLQDTMALYRSRHRLFHLDNMSEAFSARIASEGFHRPEFASKYDKMLSGEHRLRYYDDLIINLISELTFRKENLATYPVLIDVINHGTVSNVRARPKRLPVLAGGLLAGLFLGTVYVLIFKGKKI